MSDEQRAYQATPSAELERQITDPNVPKNEREWWAYHEIHDLRKLCADAEKRATEFKLDRDNAEFHEKNASEHLRRIDIVLEPVTSQHGPLDEPLYLRALVRAQEVARLFVAAEKRAEEASAMEIALRERVTEQQRLLKCAERAEQNLLASLESYEQKISDYNEIMSRPAITKSYELGAETGVQAVDMAVDRLVTSEIAPLRQQLSDRTAEAERLAVACRRVISSITYYQNGGMADPLQIIKTCRDAAIAALASES